MRLAFAFIASLFLFTACESSTERQWVVSNRSATTVRVSLITKITGDTLYQSIEPGKTRVIYSQMQAGASSGVLRALTVFDTVVIENATNNFMQKDFFNQRNWGIDISQIKKFPSYYSHQYTFVITDQDF
ncbi:MAG: hypothetical protein IM638_03805 [Bacteroidetes bacterium]|nr:hypothetical protein [Bacteroidota bacterium]